jgi:hypothetical protein
MTRRLVVVCAIGVVMSGCAVPLGRSAPECDAVETSVVLEVQSVPGSSYVSCLNGLKTGWDYRHLEARSGRSVFWLDSDRWGDSFVTVENLLSCDVGAATQIDFPGFGSVADPSIQFFKDVVSETTVNVVLVPEDDDQVITDYVTDIRVQLKRTEIEDRAVAVSVLLSEESTAARVTRAAASGAHVVIVGVRDAEDGTLTLRLSGDTLETAGDFDDVVDAIEDVESQSNYRGTWFYVFDGGCVVYTFDAQGPGVETIERDIVQALGFYDADELRQFARDAGYNLP